MQKRKVSFGNVWSNDFGSLGLRHRKIRCIERHDESARGQSGNVKRRPLSAANDQVQGRMPMLNKSFKDYVNGRGSRRVIIVKNQNYAAGAPPDSRQKRGDNRADVRIERLLPRDDLERADVHATLRYR